MPVSRKASSLLTNIDDVLARIISGRMILHAPFSVRDRSCELVLPLEMSVECECDARIFFELKKAIDQNLVDPDPTCEALSLRYVCLEEPGCAATWCIVDGANLEALTWEINPVERVVHRVTH